MLQVLSRKQSIDLNVEVLAPFADVFPSCAFVLHPKLSQDST